MRGGGRGMWDSDAFMHDRYETCEEFSLLTLLKTHFAKRKLEYKCPKQCGAGHAFLQPCFTKLPKVLIIHAKRFEYHEHTGRFFKVRHAITIPETINLNIFCAQATDTVMPGELTSANTQSQATAHEINQINTANANTATTTTVAMPPDMKNEDLAMQQALMASMLGTDENGNANGNQDNNNNNNNNNGSNDNGGGIFGFGNQLTDEQISKFFSIGNIPKAELFDPVADERLLPDESTTIYHLCCQIHHSGGYGGGHYYADVLDLTNNQWKRHNDSSVWDIPKGHVFSRHSQKTAYILYYVHQSVLNS